MSPRPAGGSAAGYSLIELVISTAIMLTITGAIFGLMSPAHGTSQAQTEVADVQQRMRVASDAIFKELVMAGAGVFQGPVAGSLINSFAPVLPRLPADPPTVFRDNAILVTSVASGYSQTTLNIAVPPNSPEFQVNVPLNCPIGVLACGFTPGMVVLVFDTAGHFDTFQITKLAPGDAGGFLHQGSDANWGFESGDTIAQGSRVGFYRDPATNQLRRNDGWLGDTPVADNVVGLTFSYFGDPNPPRLPKKTGVANCLYDAAGNYGSLGILPVSDGSLSALTPAMLTDGPFCGAGSNQYDADLLRIRKIRATLRIQVASDMLRGLDSTLWTNPGRSLAGAGSVPDYAVTFEVTPRNLNLAR